MIDAIYHGMVFHLALAVPLAFAAGFAAGWLIGTALDWGVR